MARGHRSHGRGRGGGTNIAAAFEASIDVLHNYPIPATLMNGMYTFVGN